MLLIYKIGTKWPDDPYRGWRDGQIVDLRPDDYVIGVTERKHFAFIRVSLDFWAVRGSTDWKAWNSNIEMLKKYLAPKDSNGKYSWEFGALKDESRLRCRDWFIDTKWLLDQKLIKQQDFQNIYNKDVNSPILNIDRDFTTLLFHEDEHTRLTSQYSDIKGSISAGTYQIGTGAGADYATWAAFEADIAAQLTGNLTGEGQNEETSISSPVTFDLDTNTYLLKCIAESGAEHNGGAYGNGARIGFSPNDYIGFWETVSDTLDDIEVSNLAIDCSAAGSIGVYLRDCGNAFLNRLLISCAGSTNGINQSMRYVNSTKIYNCIIYGNSSTPAISFYNRDGYCAGKVLYMYNNTLIGCNYGIYNEYGTSDQDADLIIKNNLEQASATAGYSSDWYGTTSKNVSEDATSPDASYQSKDVHTNSVFLDYGNDDYRLDVDGDSTNLAILDDGDDLSGIFTDDIQGQTRSTWYIGASEIVSAGGISIPVAMHHYKNIRSK